MAFIDPPARPLPAPASDPHRLGVHVRGGGVDVAVQASRASRVDVCFWVDGKEQNFTLSHNLFGVWHGFVPGISAGTRYGFRVWGRWNPSAGLRHNPAKLLVDPYARGIEGEVQQGPEIYDYEWQEGHPGHPHQPNGLDSAGFNAFSVVVPPAYSAYDSRPRTPWRDTVIYEAHVKGLTQLMPLVPAELRGTYAGLAHPAVIEHLQRIGITALELLPIHAKMTEPALAAAGRSNYWGYNTLSFFAPEPSYATAAARGSGAAAVLEEFTGMVHRLHEAGLEVILDVVYNHTCEGGQGGPSVSWRGLDNSTYYVLGENGASVDYTGCGNSLDFTHTPVVRQLLDSLRYWVREVGVDGFRFDLAVTLGRHRERFSPTHPSFVALTTDPVLRDVKLINEPWDVGPDGWRTGQFPVPMADWNDRYRNTLRQFWLADLANLHRGHVPAPPHDLGNRLSGSADLFGFGELPGGRSPLASVNYVTAHDGFTLADLVMYSHKNNRANGEDNRDGTDDNRSWNHGHEGELSIGDPNSIIRPLRRRSVRNLLGSLLVSAGTPMVVAGDEFGRSQQGNNNAYNQDNELSWLEWGEEAWQDSLSTTFAYLTQLRRSHEALRPVRFASGRPPAGDELADLAWFGPDGLPKGAHTWHEPHCRVLQMQRSGEGSARDALIVFNGDLNQHTVCLAPGRGKPWELVWDSTWERPESRFEVFAAGESVTLETHSMQIYLSR